MPVKRKIKEIIVCIFLVISPFFAAQTNAQGEAVSPVEFESLETFMWLGNYGVFRVYENFYVTGELHYRRQGGEQNPFIGQMAQVYNRWGVQWNPTKKFSATWGGVLRFDWNSQNRDLKDVILEPRLWHEYLFAMPFDRFMIYHRVRFEHRWSTRHAPNSEWIFRNRYRYMFIMKYPLNKKKLVPGAVYFGPNVEIIMQSGSSVINSPLEDLRLFPAIGYIHNPRVSFSIGPMYTMGQRLQTDLYRQRWILRFNTYINLDWRNTQDQIPIIGIFD